MTPKNVSLTHRACLTCGAPFQPRHPRQRHCPTHHPHGRAQASPTTRAQTTQYDHARQRILATNPHCAICGQPGADTIDHIIPIAHGGTNTPTNLQPAHRWCNGSKGATPPNNGKHTPPFF